jgi:predicted RecB family nuclease
MPERGSMQRDSVRISSELFGAYLKCPTKCFLRSLGYARSENGYANWVKNQEISYQDEGIRHLVEGVGQLEVATAPIDSKVMCSPQWRLAVRTVVRTQNLESNVHAIERLLAEGEEKSVQLIPIRLISRNKVHKHDKLLLALDALALCEMLDCEVRTGKIIHGNGYVTLKVNTAALANEVRKLTEEITVLISNTSPPELILNRHCPECEFQNQCRENVIVKDDISLLSGITETERNSHRSRGIFTVAQLSYTFKSRRPPKRAKNPATQHYFALRALAIRENTVYIHGTPRIPKTVTQVYLDIEGLPDDEFYYLIGALIVTDGKESFHSFWADDESQEQDIFLQFVDAVCRLGDYRILHFGEYETVALKRMKARLPGAFHPKIDAILERATNLLSIIHPHVYFPVYSNGLKDIGRCLGFKRAHENVTGLQSIVWRKDWSIAKAPDIKAQLCQYNEDDCRELKHVFEFIRSIISSNDLPAAGPEQRPIVNTADLRQTRTGSHRFRKIEFAVPELDIVNRAAYFDYQRQKVFVRAGTSLKRILKRELPSRSQLKANKVIQVDAKKCCSCGSRKVSQLRAVKRTVIDLKFFRGGAKKWVTEYLSWNYKCAKCGTVFTPEGVPADRAPKYGHGLATWCIYNNLVCGQNMLRVRRALKDIFDLDIPQPTIFRFKSVLRDTLQPIYDRILVHLLNGSLLHIDETEVKLRGCNGYVWVFASMDAVYFEYRDSRKAQFLGPLLEEFKGVLISDFFTGYDSLRCPQQKCLVHLIRDMNEDLLSNSFDNEFKELGQRFAQLLQQIVKTVDKYGLKRRHFRKHRDDVDRFLKSVEIAKYSSPIATRYQERMGKYGSRLFTFLNYDGVPWNNNNAEHAIKGFARVRRFSNGRFTEDSIREYLVMLSVVETCGYQNVDTLRFLLSHGDNCMHHALSLRL